MPSKFLEWGIEVLRTNRLYLFAFPKRAPPLLRSVRPDRSGSGRSQPVLAVKLATCRSGPVGWMDSREQGSGEVAVLSDGADRCASFVRDT